MSTVVKDLGAVSAYAYAVEKGYTGTEEEFAELMASYANVAQRAENAAEDAGRDAQRAEDALNEFTSVTATASTLPAGSSATAEYNGGQLEFGIPKGDKGDKGDNSVYAVLGRTSTVIPTDENGYVTSDFVIEIPVALYNGLTPVTGVIQSDDMSVTRVVDDTYERQILNGTSVSGQSSGTITYTIPAGWKPRLSGKNTITVYILGKTLTYYHTYAIAKKGDKGDKGDAVLGLEITPDVSVIAVDQNNVIKKTQMLTVSVKAFLGTERLYISSISGAPYLDYDNGDGTGEWAEHGESVDQTYGQTGFYNRILAGKTLKDDTKTSTLTIKARPVPVLETSPTYTLTAVITTLVDHDGKDGDVTTEQMNAAIAEAVEPVEREVSEFDAALALKADAIGNYPDLAVGTAEQIDSDTVVSEDVAPYQFRQSISGASNRAYDKIVGGSLAVNQLAYAINADNWYANQSTINFSNGVATFTATAQYGGMLSLGNAHRPVIINEHKYLFLGEIKKTTASANVTFGITFGNVHFLPIKNSANWEVYSAIVASTNTGLAQINCQDNRTSGWDANQTRNIMVFDLTAMFGSTIADYVYGLETATAGSGVAWLKSHFPRIFNAGYIPYNAGELVSVHASAHKMVGFNQWDEEWEQGSINDSGVNVASTGTIRSKNYIRVVAGATYYFYCGSNTGFYIFAYDADKTFISKIARGVGIGWTYTIPEECVYIRFRMYDPNYGSTYNHDICINLHWDGERDGEYEPYEEHSYPLDSDVTLRGIPKLDANNNLYYDGDEYVADGTVTRRYGIVDLGTLTWSVNVILETNRFAAAAPGGTPSGTNLNVICPKYVTSNAPTYGNTADKNICTSSGYIYLRDDSYESAAALKTALSGVYLVYELATPTTETAQPFTNPQVVDASGTEEYVTDSVVPVGHVTKYVENLKAKLESAPDSPAEDGDYIVRQTDGVNEYVPLDSAPAITAKADVSELLKAFPTDTASGAIASFTDGAELPLKSLTVDIEPIQDLHGQESPYPAGGGVNQWDEEVELGLIDTTTGANTASSSNLRSKNFIPVLPSTAYYFKATAGMAVNGAYYDADKNFVSALGNVANGTFTTPSNAHYMRFYLASAYGTTYNHDISINYPATDTAYHPYSNICPISGHTQAVVTRTGKNLFDKSAVSTGMWLSTTTGLEEANASYCASDYIPVKSGETVYIPGSGTARRWFYDRYKNPVTYLKNSSNQAFTPLADGYIRVTIAVSGSDAKDLNTYQIEYGSTATAYEPYSGQSINIQLGQTVYGGTLDVLSGELTVDRAMADLGTLNWTYVSNANYPRFITNIVGAVGAKDDNSLANIICSVYGNATINNIYRGEKDKVLALASTASLWVRDTSYTDATAFKTAVTGQTLVYELATPITVTLTPNELSTLLGANNIWSDAGEVTAEYRADPTLFIQRKIAEALS